MATENDVDEGPDAQQICKVEYASASLVAMSAETSIINDDLAGAVIAWGGLASGNAASWVPTTQRH